MATAHVDRLTTLELQEAPRGASDLTIIVDLIRVARVVDIDITIINDDSGRGYFVLQKALDVLDTRNLVIGSTAALHADLVLVDRIARLVPGENDKVDVELRYEHRGRTLDSVPPGTFIQEGATGLRQIVTHVDRNGKDLRIKYVYPALESDPKSFDPNLTGLKQTLASASVFIPNETIVLTGRVNTEDPNSEVWNRIGMINNDVYHQSLPGTWLCSAADYAPYSSFPGANASVWEFRYQLQRNPHGWNPDVWFQDPRQKGVPDGIVHAPGPGPHVPPGVGPEDVIGHYVVDWYGDINFTNSFPLFLPPP